MAQNQCVANIENNPMNYERDWQLDDSSQSSFKPCPQGSGSMTPLPFHDSAHTMYEVRINFNEVNNRLFSQYEKKKKPMLYKFMSFKANMNINLLNIINLQSFLFRLFK